MAIVVDRVEAVEDWRAAERVNVCWRSTPAINKIHHLVTKKNRLAGQKK